MQYNAILALLHRLMLSSWSCNLNVLVNNWLLVKVSTLLWHVLRSQRRRSKHVGLLIEHGLNKLIGATWNWYGLPHIIGVRVIVRVVVVVNLLPNGLYLLLFLMLMLVGVVSLPRISAH